jgi:hypothetical protein
MGAFFLTKIKTFKKKKNPSALWALSDIIMILGRESCFMT